MDPFIPPQQPSKVLGPDDRHNQRGPDLPKEKAVVTPYVWEAPRDEPPECRWPAPAFRSGFNPGWLDLTVLIDSSASMLPHRVRMTMTVNAFLHSRATGPLDSLASVVFFNDIRWFHDQGGLWWGGAPPVNLQHYHPSGPTALLDAMDCAIDCAVGGSIMLTDAERPGKTVIAVYTDGGENASQWCCTQYMSDLMQFYTETQGWEFLFLAERPDGL